MHNFSRYSDTLQKHIYEPQIPKDEKVADHKKQHFVTVLNQ